MSGDVIVAAADGSSLSNPGPAGWAWYVDDEHWASGGWDVGTNNMGELMAVLDLVQQTEAADRPLHVLCDSQYVINCCTKWIPGWKRRGWRKADGKPVLNVDLLKELDLALAGRPITFEWVKGHSGHDLNEAADDRARAAATAHRDGRAVDTGPGWAGSSSPAREQAFVPSVAPEPEPDLFSLVDEPAVGSTEASESGSVLVVAEGCRRVAAAVPPGHTMSVSIDLNADLGEGFASWRMGDDAAMLDVVTSANVACGYHAGDAQTMLDTCRQAAERGVVVGAHVSYRDLAGFGRHFIDVPADRLYAEVCHQIVALAGLCALTGARLGYVKPHGALYNAIVHHEAQAEAVARAVAAVNAGTGGGLGLLGLPDSAVQRASERHGLDFHVEAFADRGYRADGTLVPRSEPGAVLHDPAEVAARVVRMVTDQVVTAVDGTEVAVRADSICVHGDTPGAVDLAGAVREALAAADVALGPFVNTATRG